MFSQQNSGGLALMFLFFFIKNVKMYSFNNIWHVYL